jgi:hypothetical protein
MAADLGLGSQRYTPSGLRAGRATSQYRQGIEIQRLRYAGRWTNLKTLEHYIQEATAASVQDSISKTSQQRIASVLDQGPRFAEPPLLPWAALFSRRRQQLAQSRWQLQQQTTKARSQPTACNPSTVPRST